MQIEIVGFLLLIAIGFVVAGWLLKEQKESLYLFLAGFIIVMISGIIIAGIGIEFTSVIIVNNGIVAIEQYTVPAYVEYLAGSALLISGFWGVITMSLYIARVSKLKEGEDYALTTK